MDKQLSDSWRIWTAMNGIQRFNSQEKTIEIQNNQLQSHLLSLLRVPVYRIKYMLRYVLCICKYTTTSL